MIKRAFKGVLFDLDGTLLDTLEDLGGSVNRVLEARGWPQHPIDAYRWFVGEGAKMLVERAIPEAHRSDEVIEEILADYRAMYSKHWADTTKPYDGIPELLDALVERGMVLGILSNKPHGATLLCAERYLSNWPFRVVLGQREHIARKPDPEGAFEAARVMMLQPADILYVGDTSVDMQTALAAGMVPCGVTWGFRPEQELKNAGAAAIVHHPSELAEAIAARSTS